MATWDLIEDQQDADDAYAKAQERYGFKVGGTWSVPEEFPCLVSFYRRETEDGPCLQAVALTYEDVDALWESPGFVRLLGLRKLRPDELMRLLRYDLDDYVAD